ncbi:MAG TPA: hypothetical protein VEK15_13510 [Vicinamibacteria bacterium]|nr:hypothetical protein [Vicinamibacteria bacterium]
MKRLVFTLATLFLAAVVSAQSLAEVARKEKERRKKLQTSESHTYTEVDLRGQGPMTQVTGAGTAAAPAEPAEDEPTGESESGEREQPDPTQTREYWQGRLSRLDGRIRELESQLESPRYTANPRGASERQAVERELEQARADRGALMDEARRAGVPPGWLR